MSDRTIYQMLRDTVERHGGRPALGWKEGKGHAYLSYAELWEKVLQTRSGLASLGLQRGDRIAILSENRPEWAITDLAAQGLGAITVPIYTTLPAAQVRHVLGDSGARILLVSDRKQLRKAVEVRPELPALEQIVAVEPSESGEALAFSELAERAGSVTDEELDARAKEISPDDVATFIYTSGTTGDPKGAMLSHRNLLHTGYAARTLVNLDENDVFLSFAPLSHIVERVGGHYLPLICGALIVYSQGIFAIASEFEAVRPTLFLCVPRVYEAMQEKILEAAVKAPPSKKKMFDRALQAGLQVVDAAQRGQNPGLITRIRHLIADRLVLSRIRNKATGGRIRYLVAGGAPLNPETARFFGALGVQILEGYGLTELPVISLNRPGRARFGTVGELIPGIEVRLEEDGEILARGPSRMLGYFANPQATAAAIDPEGWFHTGDIGELSADGYLRITDRKKDIIVLANGKNVAPQPIENRLKQSPYIAEIVLFGDREPIVSAIVVPAFDRLRGWAEQNSLPAADNAELVARQETRKLIKEEIDRLSDELADFEKVKRFTLLDHPFTIEGGELTPTLKVRRRVVAEKYGPNLARTK